MINSLVLDAAAAELVMRSKSLRVVVRLKERKLGVYINFSVRWNVQLMVCMIGS
jgi:hypothetical protein